MGKLGRPKGLSGDLRVWMHDPQSEILFDLDRVKIGRRAEMGNFFEIEEVSRAHTKMVVRFGGVTTREAAEKLTGHEIFADRSQFPPLAAGEYYCCDLIGFSVSNVSGELLGTLEEIWPTASNDIYVVRNQENELLFPATQEVIVRVDLEQREIVVSPPEEILAEVKHEI